MADPVTAAALAKKGVDALEEPVRGFTEKVSGASGGELGDVVAEMLQRPVWEDAERALHRAAHAPVGSAIDPDVLLLVWLRQVAANLVQSPGLAHNLLWVLRNVASVLLALPDLPAVEKR